MAVKKTTKSIVIDIDEVHEIRVRALMTGGLDQGPHITLKVGGAYSLNVPEVTRRLRWEGFATAGVQTTALWSDRSGQSRTPSKDRRLLSVWITTQSRI